MKVRRPTGLLWVLAGTVALAAFGDSAPVAMPVASDGPAAEGMMIIRALAPRFFTSAPAGDPFAAAASSAVSSAASRPAVPPAPTLPAPLPWRVLGKQRAAGEGWAVFLARGDATWVVRAGDTLEETWRVLAIEPPTLTLRHLGNGSQRRLDIGAARE